MLGSNDAGQIGDDAGARVRAIVASAAVPGCAIAVTTASGPSAVLLMGNASLRPRQEVHAGSRFHLFSGTKVYTAAAVMLLVERGQVSLDDPITDHLPDLPLQHPVTIRQLASHSSGLPDTLRAFLAVHRGDVAGPSTQAALARYRLDHGRQPGREVAYRNVNFAILGELVSRVSGRPYEQFVRDELLEPLGAELGFDHANEAPDQVVKGHVPRWSPMRVALRLIMPEVAAWIFEPHVDGFVPLRSFGLDTAAIGGLIGPVQSFVPMLREMLSEADGVLSTASKRELLSRQSEGAAGIVSREGVGIGWKLGRVGDTTFWNHEGGGPGFCSETRLYPDDGLGVVILMNRSQTASSSRVCHRACEALRLNHQARAGEVAA